MLNATLTDLPASQYRHVSYFNSIIGHYLDSYWEKGILILIADCMAAQPHEIPYAGSNKHCALHALESNPDSQLVNHNPDDSNKQVS